MTMIASVLPAHSQYETSRAAQPPTFHLHEVIGALSHAIDMTEGQPQGHAIRCALIGMRIGAGLGLPENQMADLYYTLLMKDLGCSSNAARICALYLADDITFKHDFKLMGTTLPAAIRFVLQNTGLKSGLSERFKATVNILCNGGQISRELIEVRCHQGGDIAAKLRFPVAVQDGIRALDEHWDGAGKPYGLAGPHIPITSRIALLAQVVDVFHQAEGRAAAIAEIKRRNGSWFDPDVVWHFLQIANDDSLWQALQSPDLHDRVYALAPRTDTRPLDADYLDDIAAAFADVIDAKSPFTADHSRRVMLYTDLIAEELGLGQDHRQWLRRAALLHDIGKLAVSNQILDKPGRPTDEEWKTIRTHPAHSADILARVSAFADMAPVAGAHHERLDGKGYPNGQCAKTLPYEAMILATADVYDALTADRPYRAAMPHANAMEILNKDTGTAHHPLFVQALEAALARLTTPVQDVPQNPNASISA